MVAALVLLYCGTSIAEPVHHYAYFNWDRARIRSAAFLQQSVFEGAQVKYTWRELEPAKDRYDFSVIREDLEFLTAHQKTLFVQLQDSSFYGSIVNVPEYLREDPQYHGGADRDYDIRGDDESDARPAGWVARRWDPAVRERFQKLLAALGRELDGKIAGINLPETAASFGESGRLFPKGYTFAAYREGVLENMSALKRAFPRSVAMVYANFMPGEWLPWKDNGYLASVYARASDLHLAVGGPDLLPYRRGQMNHSYKLIRECAGAIPTGIAVQEGNYSYTNPMTNRRVTVPELFQFATENLRVSYIFWFAEEPFFSRDVVPFLQKESAGKR